MNAHSGVAVLTSQSVLILQVGLRRAGLPLCAAADSGEWYRQILDTQAPKPRAYDKGGQLLIDSLLRASRKTSLLAPSRTRNSASHILNKRVDDPPLICSNDQ